jgi:hypothetical protein
VEYFAAVLALDQREMEFVTPRLVDSAGALHPIGFGHVGSLPVALMVGRPDDRFSLGASNQKEVGA